MSWMDKVQGNKVAAATLVSDPGPKKSPMEIAAGDTPLDPAVLTAPRETPAEAAIRMTPPNPAVLAAALAKAAFGTGDVSVDVSSAPTMSSNQIDTLQRLLDAGAQLSPRASWAGNVAMDMSGSMRSGVEIAAGNTPLTPEVLAKLDAGAPHPKTFWTADTLRRLLEAGAQVSPQTGNEAIDPAVLAALDAPRKSGLELAMGERPINPGMAVVITDGPDINATGPARNVRHDMDMLSCVMSDLTDGHIDAIEKSLREGASPMARAMNEGHFQRLPRDTTILTLLQDNSLMSDAAKNTAAKRIVPAVFDAPYWNGVPQTDKLKAFATVPRQWRRYSPALASELRRANLPTTPTRPRGGLEA